MADGLLPMDDQGVKKKHWIENRQDGWENNINKRRQLIYSNGFESIINITESYFGLKKGEVYTRTRDLRVKNPRHICYYYGYHYTLLTLSQLSGFFNQDHATVINAEKCISLMLETNDMNWNKKTNTKLNTFPNFDNKIRFSDMMVKLDKQIIIGLIMHYKFFHKKQKMAYSYVKN